MCQYSSLANNVIWQDLVENTLIQELRSRSRRRRKTNFFTSFQTFCWFSDCKCNESELLSEVRVCKVCILAYKILLRSTFGHWNYHPDIIQSKCDINIIIEIVKEAPQLHHIWHPYMGDLFSNAENTKNETLMKFILNLKNYNIWDDFYFAFATKYPTNDLNDYVPIWRKWKILLDNGINPCLRNPENEYVMDIVVKFEFINKLKFLLSFNVPIYRSAIDIERESFPSYKTVCISYLLIYSDFWASIIKNFHRNLNKFHLTFNQKKSMQHILDFFHYYKNMPLSLQALSVIAIRKKLKIGSLQKTLKSLQYPVALKEKISMSEEFEIIRRVAISLPPHYKF